MGEESPQQEPQEAGHTGSSVKEQRVMLAYVHLLSSFHGFQNTQGMVSSTLKGSTHIHNQDSLLGTQDCHHQGNPKGTCPEECPQMENRN